VQVLVDHRQQQLGRRPPHVDAGLADRGQGRDGVGSHVIFYLAQKVFVEGVTLTGVKG
jgi:hypothetical protein